MNSGHEYDLFSTGLEAFAPKLPHIQQDEIISDFAFLLFICDFTRFLFNQSTFIGYQGWVEILMITLVSSTKQYLRKDMQHSVHVKYVLIGMNVYF